MRVPGNTTRQTSLGRMGGPFTTTHLSIIIFSLSFLIYAFSPQGVPSTYRLIQGGEVARTAISVAQRGTFADPFAALPTGFSAHTAPAYVLLYAAVAKLFGVDRPGEIVLWSLNVGFLALQFALLPILSEQLGIGVLPGVLAAAFGAIIQPYHILLEWESLFTGALLVVLCVLTLRYFKSPRDWQHSALLGFLWGIAILTNPQCVLLLLVWPHIAAMKNSTWQLSHARRAMIVVLAGAAVACLPWFIRNYQRFHAVFFVRDNFGLELYTSNNPCARPTLLENIDSGCHNNTHPNPSPEVAGELLDKGEIAFNRDRLRQATAWISSNPGAFASLTARRFIRFWFPYLGGYRYAIPMGVLTIVSFAGFAVMFRKNGLAARMLASTLLLFPLVHYFVQFEARYRYPVFWATLLPASYAIVEFMNWLRRKPRETAMAIAKEHELVSLVK